MMSIQRITVILSILVIQYDTTTFAWNSLSSVRTFQLKRCTLEMKRGRGSIGSDEVGGTNGLSSSTMGGNGKGLGSTGQQQQQKQPVINWIPINASSKDIPKEENKVSIIDTNLITMKVSNTNPTGAVSVLKYKDETYCFSINCPSCQIPLTKAIAVDAPSTESIDGTKSTTVGPLLVCDLCKATYDLKTGVKQTKSAATSNPGIFGSIVKTVFAANNNAGNLKTYKLGERNGKLLIAID